MLEELGAEYRTKSINIGKDEQFSDEFIAISPNNKIPAIIDHDSNSGEPVKMFESGAILIYLAEKFNKFLPSGGTDRCTTIQWLMFQMGGVGPMFGQNGYFQGYCPEDVPLAKTRYHNETKRLYGVMNKRLAETEYLAGSDYSLADVATYPWTMPKQWDLHAIDIEEFPHVKRWNATVAARPAVQRGVALMAADQKVGNPTDEAYKNMFGDEQYQKR